MRSDSSGARILIGEDDLEVRTYLETALRCQGFMVEAADNGEEVLTCLRTGNSISAVLLDIVMPKKDGMDTLREIRAMDTGIPIIMVSGAASPLNIVEAMKSGATDFLGKPVSYEDLRRVIANALASKGQPLLDTAQNSRAEDDVQSFVGSDPRIQEILSVVPQIGWSDAPVLIQGETGAGKEVLAGLLHAHSRRAAKPLLKLNCAALPSELVESELFGYERGAFTGAFQRKLGMFELADGGTILLDEIGDMDYKLQAKLLHVLQDHEFQRLGGKEPIRVNVRVLAATHNDLEKSIRQRMFREDLYYRLNVINLRVPSLRERKSDIVPLAEHLLNRHAEPGSPVPAIGASLQHAMLVYDWPGNVRELENSMRRLLVYQNQETLAAELRARAARNRLASEPAAEPVDSAPASGERILAQVTRAKEQAEAETIRAALDSTHWNRKEAAVLLGIDYKALLYKMNKLGIASKRQGKEGGGAPAVRDKVMRAGGFGVSN